MTKIISTKKRDSNLELYRILVMILIVAHHYVVNSGLMASTGPIFSNPLSAPSLFLLIFGAFGKIGINCFVLITGFFMCKKQITAQKFFKLLFEIEFYRIVIYLIFLATGYETFSMMALMRTLFPVYSIDKGFSACFLLFFLCIPFLNVLVNHLTEKQHLKLILLCSFIYILLGTVPYFYVNMNYVSWFIILYFIASYIRLYPKALFEKTKLWLSLTLISILLCIASVVACTYLGARSNSNISYLFVTDSNTFLAVLTAIFSFLLFKNLKIKYNGFINLMGASTFGVLMIHANSDAMRQWLWVDLLKNTEMYSSVWLYAHAALSVIVIFFICFIIDFVRIKFIEKPFFIIWDKLWAKILFVYKNLEHKLCVKFKISEE